jgi:S1-C subfamily serine protease
VTDGDARGDEGDRDPGDPGPGDGDVDAHRPAAEIDDLEELRARRQRRLVPLRRMLAAVVAVAMLLPAGMWLSDELGFRRASDAVVETLEGVIEGSAAADTVLLVRSVGCRPGTSSSGSAFVIETDDGPALLTNRHVVDDALQVGVRPLDGSSNIEIVGVRVSDRADVAVLEVADPDALPPPLALHGGPPEVGTPVRLIGFPAATPLTTTGTVADVTPSRLLLDLQVDPGASGSPVVDDEGRVVGQVYAVTDGGQGLATPADILVEATRDTRPPAGC